MSDKLSILILEDDQSAVNALTACISKRDDMELCYATNNSNVALDMVLLHKPHIVILDLELHEGVGDGITFLKDLYESNATFKTYIFVTTNTMSKHIYNIARRYGADYIFPKYKEDYSAQNLINYIGDLKEDFLTPMHEPPSTAGDLGCNSLKEPFLSKTITELLNKVGITPKSKGFQYILEAISLEITEDTPRVALKIANAHNKTEASVIRSMQYAISRAWLHTDPDDLLRYYTANVDTTRGYPTVTEFIYYYVNMLKPGKK